jgi:hypothetical protein
MNEPIEVVPANIVEYGVIVSEFNGFDGSSRLSLRAVVFGTRPNTNTAITTPIDAMRPSLTA